MVHTYTIGKSWGVACQENVGEGQRKKGLFLAFHVLFSLSCLAECFSRRVYTNTCFFLGNAGTRPGLVCF